KATTKATITAVAARNTTLVRTKASRARESAGDGRGTLSPVRCAGDRSCAYYYPPKNNKRLSPIQKRYCLNHTRAGPKRGTLASARISPDGLHISGPRSEEHTSESSHVSISYAVFCLKKKK